MAGPQEFEIKAVDVKMADSAKFEETDTDAKLADPQEFEENVADFKSAGPSKVDTKGADLEMAHPKSFEENDADVEREVLPQYQANDMEPSELDEVVVCPLPPHDVDVERADDNSVQHTWLCPGGDPTHCGCPRRLTRRELWAQIAREFGYTLLFLAALVLIFFAIARWSIAATDAGDTHAQAENCTVVYSYANSMGVCVNETKLD